jgi:hypothetical protein
MTYLAAETDKPKELTTSIPTTENQCPAWCAGKPGHRWEDEDNDGNPYRYHLGETAHLHVDGIETGLGRHYDGKILLAILDVVRRASYARPVDPAKHLVNAAVVGRAGLEPATQGL